MGAGQRPAPAAFGGVPAEQGLGQDHGPSIVVAGGGEVALALGRFAGAAVAAQKVAQPLIVAGVGVGEHFLDVEHGRKGFAGAWRVAEVDQVLPLAAVGEGQVAPQVEVARVGVGQRLADRQRSLEALACAGAVARLQRGPRHPVDRANQVALAVVVERRGA